jgi:hypothetical protein
MSYCVKLRIVKDAREFGEPHWSKDFVEHLRTVHFSLIAVSTTLILLMASSRPYDPMAAIIQLGNLDYAAKNFDLDPLFSMKSSVNGEDYVFEAQLPKAPHATFNVHIVSFWVLGDTSGQSISSLPASAQPEYPDYVRKFSGDNILQLENWWSLHNVVAQVWVAKSFESKGSLIDDGQIYPANMKKVEGHPRYARIYNCKLKQIPLPLSPRNPQLVFEGKDYNDEGATLSIPAKDVENVQLNASDFIAMPNRCATFHTCFPDLAKASKGLELVTLADLRTHLIQQLEKGDTVFEVFGMKVPLSLITSWGIVIVLSVQLYFFLHMREFHSKIKPLDPGLDVPWIAVYPSRMSRAVYLTTLLLPLIAVSLLASHASASLIHSFAKEHLWCYRWLIIGELATLLLSTFITALLSWLIWKHRPRTALHNDPA